MKLIDYRYCKMDTIHDVFCFFAMIAESSAKWIQTISENRWQINFIQRTTNEDVKITKLPYKSFRVTLIWSTQTFPKYRWPFVYHCTYNNTENLVSCVVVFLPFLASLCEMASLTNAAELSMTAMHKKCFQSIWSWIYSRCESKWMKSQVRTSLHGVKTTSRLLTTL